MSEIAADSKSPLFDTRGMAYREFPSDFSKIRYYTLILVSSAPPRIKEFNLLEQQISEIIKNGIAHGNKNDPRKFLKIWYDFTREYAHLIVEDEGEGFREIKAWNEFNRRRLDCIDRGDVEGIMNFISFRTQKSSEKDGGNALFAALEYWNGGLVFNDKLNAVAVKKVFDPVPEVPPGFKPWDLNQPV
ncbi:MAG: ATP-binding protein [Treponema sp.]|jgi:hypothetical protein|nr:ATP-binding protein [Treponema sp.]